MSDALSIAVNGLNSSVARATQSARNIVKASSTGENLDVSLVNLRTERTNVTAAAAVIKTVHIMDKALLDIKA